MSDLSSRIRALSPTLGPAGRMVLDYIERHPAETLASTARQLGARCGTSDASIVRTAKALGYSGLPELKQAIIDQAGPALPSPSGNMRRTLSDVPHAEDAIAAVIETHLEGLRKLREEATLARLLTAVEALDPARRILVFGIGPSGALAGYASALLNRIGRRSLPLTQAGAMLADQLLDLQPGDAVLCLAYGRPYPEILAVLGEAGQRGLTSVLITDDLEGEIPPHAQIAVPVPAGAAVSSHSTASPSSCSRRWRWRWLRPRPTPAFPRWIAWSVSGPGYLLRWRSDGPQKNERAPLTGRVPWRGAGGCPSPSRLDRDHRSSL